MGQIDEEENKARRNSAYDAEDPYERERRLRRSRRIEEMRRQKRKQAMYRKLALRLCPVAVAVLVVIIVAVRLFSSGKGTADGADSTGDNPSAEVTSFSQGEPSTGDMVSDTASIDEGSMNAPDKDNNDGEAPSPEESTPVVDSTVYRAEETASTDHYFEADSVMSTFGIVIDADTGTVLAEQNAYTRVSPASMTKILTVLVAAEHVTDLDDTFTITQDINDFVFSNDCSAVNFDNDETVTVRDLFYGTILPSGADAALGLATYVAGSQEAFVDLMNEKLSDLGLSGTAHFTNCIGLYDENHYCTMYDMAMILEAAVNNEICREVLSAHTYTTSSTPQHPDGIEISNWFLRRIEDKDTHGEVLYAKTGYVVQSRSCAASYGTDRNGKGYIIVTGDAHSSWRCIYDHVALYDKYLPAS